MRPLLLLVLLVSACDRATSAPAAVASATPAGSTGVAISSFSASPPHACTAPASDDCILQGVDFMYGRSVVKDEAKGAGLWKAACEAKSPTGCTLMGDAYQWGRGFPKEKWKSRGIRSETASEMTANAGVHRSACEAGHAPSCLRSGNPARAAKLSAEECERGDLMSCAALGRMHQDGAGVPQDAKKALSLFEKSCTGGDGSGCLGLASAYENGSLGQTKNPTKAAEFHTKACEGGEEMGCENAGHIYEDGRGVKPDRAAAMRLYKIACDWRGDGTAASCNAYKRVGGK